MIEIGGKLFRISAIEAVIPVGHAGTKALIMLSSGSSVTVDEIYINVKAALTAPLIEGGTS